MEQRGFTLWLTGLPGSGKSTLANEIGGTLLERGCKAEVLDGSEARGQLSGKLGFSKEDRDAHVQKLGYVSGMLARNGVAAIVSAISPFTEARDEVRSATYEPFILVYVNCPPEKCAERDPKGMYAKAHAGEVEDFTGVQGMYEPPENAEVVVQTGEESVEESCKKILLTLEALELIPKDDTNDYSEEEEEEVKKRLKDLGYI